LIWRIDKRWQYTVEITGRRKRISGCWPDRQRQVVGADFGIAQEKPAIHQRPSTAFETEVSQIQAARIAQGGCERVVLLNKAPPCPVYDLANSTTRLQDRAIRREI
jgi:hypothetical protein